MNPLHALFTDGDFRFRMTMRRGTATDFFRPWDPGGTLLAQRRAILKTAGAQCVQSTREGDELRGGLSAMAATWALPVTGDWMELGAQWEPDVLVLSPDVQGRHRLRGGVLCFPTGWDLAEKMGGTLEEIHGVVPGLNAAIGDAMQRFLNTLGPGVTWLRDNWGLAASDELDLHPRRQVPAPGLPVRLDRLWLRVEHQALVGLPVDGGVLFGIRIGLHRLDAVAADPVLTRGLRQALLSMPHGVLRYKRLEVIHDELVQLLS